MNLNRAGARNQSHTPLIVLFRRLTAHLKNRCKRRILIRLPHPSILRMRLKMGAAVCSRTAFEESDPTPQESQDARRCELAASDWVRKMSTPPKPTPVQGTMWSHSVLGARPPHLMPGLHTGSRANTAARVRRHALVRYSFCNRLFLNRVRL